MQTAPQCFRSLPSLRIIVHSLDIGKVIGKEGRTARALRTIVGAIGMSQAVGLRWTSCNGPNQESAAA